MRKIISHLTLLAALAGGALSSNLSAQQINEPWNFGPKGHHWGAKTFFPLIAWDYVSDEATVKSMAECGITAIAFVPPKMLDICAKYGVKAVVFDEHVAPAFGELFNSDKALKALPALIAKVNKKPAVYGYHLRDEPGADQFPALGRAAALVKKLAPGKWPYLNMYPGTGDDYVKFLEEFVAKCDPTIISYDNYPVGADGGFSWGFWANLADARTVAVEHNLPLETIVLTSPHWGYGDVTPAHLRLQTYGALAYGAKGLSYYKFCSASLPIMNCPDLGNFRNGPLNEFGDRTAMWEELKTVNHHILNLAPTLLKLHSDDVYQIGEVAKRNHGPTDKTLVKTVPGGEFIVGDFTHEDGSRWVMIVNKSVKNSETCNPVDNVPPKAQKYLYSVTGELKPFPAAYYFLAPGQGVLIQLVP